MDKKFDINELYHYGILGINNEDLGRFMKYGKVVMRAAGYFY